MQQATEPELHVGSRRFRAEHSVSQDQRTWQSWSLLEKMQPTPVPLLAKESQHARTWGEPQDGSVVAGEGLGRAYAAMAMLKTAKMDSNSILVIESVEALSFGVEEGFEVFIVVSKSLLIEKLMRRSEDGGRQASYRLLAS